MNLIRRLLSARYVFLGVFAAVVALGWLVLEQLPVIYESSARLAIERPDGAAAGDATDDSEILSQRVHLAISNTLRRENVVRHLRAAGVLEAGADDEDRLAAIEHFRDRASIEFDNVSVVNEYTGKFGLMSFGLLVGYRDEDPERAYEFAARLVDDILGGVRDGLGTVATETDAFLTRQLEQSGERLAEIERRIADYKNRNALYLPELYAIAVRQLDDLDSRRDQAEASIAQLRRDRAGVSSDLALSNPDALMFSEDGTRIETPVERLEQLRIDRAIATSRYASDHPAVRALDQEIAALEQHTAADDTRSLEVELEASQARLSTLRERYANEHPDVVAAARRIEELGRALDVAARADAPRETSRPSNPAFNRLLARRESIDEEIGREQRRLEEFDARRSAVEAQLARMPDTERGLAELERLRAREEQSLAELQAQMTATRLRSGMREAELLERIVVIEPPSLPLTPVEPRKPLLAALFVMLALCAGGVAALLSVWSRDAIWSRGELEELTDSTVVLIPRFT